METKEQTMREIEKFCNQWKIEINIYNVWDMLIDIESEYGLNKESMERFYYLYTTAVSLGKNIATLKELGYS